MANLIITIIGIAIIGIAAAMAVFYGGAALGGSQAQVYANTLISESQQLYLADTQYMLDKGLTSFSDFPPDAPLLAGGYTNGNARVPIMGFGAFGFLNGDVQNLSLTIPEDATYGGIGGDNIGAFRVNYAINGTNAIIYNIDDSQSGDFSPASMADETLVKICKAINATLPPPAGIAYTDRGIPQMDAGTSTHVGVGGSGSTMYAYTDTTRTTLNYCYTGPAGDTYEIYFAFSN